jgi:hypothetical protein
MNADSGELEAFYDRLKYADDKLIKSGSKEIKRADAISELYELARDWLRICSILQASDVVDVEVLREFDEQMIQLRRATESRTRASAYRKILAPLMSEFFERVTVPVIRFEASPAQVAGRELLGILSGQITSAEANYIDEAARCLTLRCHRAAIVMLWAAAIARLHNEIEQMSFTSYNLALAATVAKKTSPFKHVYNTPISSVAELQKIRDFDILVIGMELWKYDNQTFEELERLLGTRNSAAHPGMSNPIALDVLQFARKLNDFIFAKIRFASSESQ